MEVEFSTRQPEHLGYEARYDLGTVEDLPTGDVTYIPGSLMGGQFIVDVSNDTGDSLTARLYIVGRDPRGGLRYCANDFISLPEGLTDTFAVDVMTEPADGLEFEAIAEPWQAM